MNKKALVIGTLILVLVVVGTQITQKKEGLGSTTQETPRDIQEGTHQTNQYQKTEGAEIQKDTTTMEAEYQYRRQNITFLKLVSSENCMYTLDQGEIEELKSLNINGIRICPLYSVKEDGGLREDVPEKAIVGLIRKAHRAGFAVFLEPNVIRYGFLNLDNPKYVEDVYAVSLYWAKIAEEEEVEFFSPLNEPDVTFANSNLINQWIERSKSLKSVFSGNLVLKFADIGPEKIANVSGYDYIAFDIMWGDDKYQELREHMMIAVERGNKLKKQYNLKGFFLGEVGAERSRVDKVTQAEIFRTVLEETWGKVDGYCFLGWSNLEFKFRDNDEAKEVIKEWYSRS
jgi:hypothetical protein